MSHPQLPPIDFYGPIHKGLRRELFLTCLQAGAVAVDDSAEVLALAGRVERLIRFVRSHAGHEETHYHPILAARLPTVHARLQAQHAEHEPLLAAVEVARESLLLLPTATAAARLYGALNRFAAATLQHTADEEAAMPMLREACPRGELAQAYGALMATMDPAEKLAGFELICAAISPAERDAIVRAANAAASAAANAAALPRVNAGPNAA